MRDDSVDGSNAVRLLVQMASETDLLTRIQLAGLNLAGIRFSSHGLRDVIFDDADLTNADFRGSDIAGSSFDNCIIKGTRFDDDKTMLSTIKFRNVRRFYSAYVGETFIDDPTILVKTIGQLPRRPDEAQPACATARQLRHLFGKIRGGDRQGTAEGSPQGSPTPGQADRPSAGRYPSRSHSGWLTSWRLRTAIGSVAP